ncbi:MAG: exo-alpha-sialidase [Chthoniobacterales bacterium]|nr:exo-alpha-sialidase [Chthoniobacterales bacterium]
MHRKSASTRRPWLLAMAILLIAIGLAGIIWQVGRAPERRAHGERKERCTGRDYARATEVQAHPHTSTAAPGWDSERVVSGNDEWEPFVAADPSSHYVYQMTTRFNSKISGIYIRRSADGGATWEPAHDVGPISKWQADPQVQVAANGTVFAVWLDGPTWTSRLTKSYDHGATWTPSIAVAPSLRWTDHPWLVVSPDGQDVYIGLNHDDSFFVTSHDGGATFSEPYRTSYVPAHWWDHNGGAIAPDGSIYFVVINFFLDYRGPSEINVISSHDRGATWQAQVVARSQPPPGCVGIEGCEYGFLSSTAGLAIDRDGTILVAYHGSDESKSPQQLWVVTSRDGVHWTPRQQISQPNTDASNGFPAAANGPAAGDFRVVWQGNKNGDAHGWNTYYRRTTDGGVSWGEIELLSDRTTGAPYKNPAGFLFPYGDYLGLSVDGDGNNHVIWGEGASYDGPGGSWYTRGGTH